MNGRKASRPIYKMILASMFLLSGIYCLVFPPVEGTVVHHGRGRSRGRIALTAPAPIYTRFVGLLNCAFAIYLARGKGLK